MALTDLFKKNEEKEDRPVNLSRMVGIRALAVGYCLYSLWQLVKMYIAGGETAPSIWLLIGSFVLLGGGSVAIIIITIIQYRNIRQAERDRLDAEDEELARLALEAENNADEDADEAPEEEEPEEEA